MLEISLSGTGKENMRKIATMIKHGATMIQHLVKSLLDRSLLVNKVLVPSYKKESMQSLVQEVV